MVARADPLWFWLFPLLIGGPWIAATLFYWRRRPRDGAIPPSAADLARRRLWVP